MELKIFSNKQGKALYFMKSVRKKGQKNPTKEKVEFLGYLHDLEKEYEDPVAHFRQLAKDLSPGRGRQSDNRSLAINLQERYDLGGIPFRAEKKDNPFIDNAHYFGHHPLSVIYHKLEIDQFLNNRRSKWGIKANMDMIFKLLVFGRILTPDSKLATWRMRERFMLGNSTITDDDVYRSFPFLSEYSADLVRHLHNQVQGKWGRDTSLLYYDVTNFYFEINGPDRDRVVIDEWGEQVVEQGLRKRGVSKEHRKLPIVQMGLFMDREGIPVSYGMFPGNTNDVSTFVPMIRHTKENLGLDKMIYVADKGVSGGTNICNVLAQRQGYIIARSVRMVDRETEGWVLDLHGYEESLGEVLAKSLADEQGRGIVLEGEQALAGKANDPKAKVEVPVSRLKWRRLVTERRTAVDERDRKVKVEVNTVQIAFWSRKYAVKARIDRQEAIEKARRDGTVFNSHGANKYFKKEAYDAKSGELHPHIEFLRAIDEEAIARDERYDGYYLLETNVVGVDPNERPWEGTARFRTYDQLFELNRTVTAADIVEMYRGLWRIEESFKITKSVLATRPMYVRMPHSMEAHLLTCFVSLLLLRLLEVKELGNTIPHERIVDSLRRAQLVHVESNIYMSTFVDRVLERIGIATGIDMTRKFFSKQDVRSLNNQTKQQ
jgi:hypothetical protein